MGIRMVVAALSIAACGDDGASGSAGAEDSSGGPVASTSAATSGVAGTDGGTTGQVDGSGSGAGPKYDLAQPDAGSGCGLGGGDLEFSNIWIANSLAGTVSKIDTVTRVERARYYTGPLGQRDPSRTSVDLDGDMAVANREGGVTKIVARTTDCVDVDGDGQITTSSGANDVHPWGADECVLWNTPLPVRSRPVAWTSGQPSTDACGLHVHEQLWASAPVGDDAIVYLIDGDTGDIQGQVLIPDVAPTNFDPVYHGIYGAAVDANDDFWGSVKSAEPLLVHVSLADLSYEVIEIPLAAPYPSYGMTVDADGFVWVGGEGAVQRYDPVTAAWDAVTGVIPAAYYRGMMADGNGSLWVAVVDHSGGIAMSSSGLARIDVDSLGITEYLTTLAGMPVQEATGVSIDYDGLVWMVDQYSNGVFVHDPQGGGDAFVGGLDGPYTYSDMTGWALSHVAGPEG